MVVWLFAVRKNGTGTELEVWDEKENWKMKDEKKNKRIKEQSVPRCFFLGKLVGYNNVSQVMCGRAITSSSSLSGMFFSTPLKPYTVVSIQDSSIW